MPSMKSLLLCLLLAVSCLGQEKPPEVSVEYDKFQKLTLLRMESAIQPTAKVAERYTIKFVAYARVPDDDKPSIFFYFSTSPQWVFKQPTLRVLVNDKTLEYRSDKVDQRIVFLIPSADFERIANAATVDFQLIPFDGVLDKMTLAGLKNLLTLTKLPPR